MIAITFKFNNDKKTEQKLWSQCKPNKIGNPGTVKHLTILPLIEYYSDPTIQNLCTEPGVSYLITADDKKILFDVGYNKNQKHPSPLLKNMDKLAKNINDIDSIFITHFHRDHIGGSRNELYKTSSISASDISLNGMKVYSPAPISCSTATTNIEVVNEPRVLSDGIVSTGSIHKALWLMGLTPEQSLAINV